MAAIVLLSASLVFVCCCIVRATAQLHQALDPTDKASFRSSSSARSTYPLIGSQSTNNGDSKAYESKWDVSAGVDAGMGVDATASVGGGGSAATDVDVAAGARLLAQSQRLTQSSTSCVEVVDAPMQQLRAPVFDEYGGFGSAIAVSGTYAVIGARNASGGDGSAYVFDIQSHIFLRQLVSPGRELAEPERFGISVALSGTRALVSAITPSGDGSAYMFDVTSGTLTWQPVVPGRAAASPDFFGHAVAVSATRALVGAPGDWQWGAGSGCAYLFDIESSRFLLKLVVGYHHEHLHFGVAVALSDVYALVGSSGDGDNDHGIGSGSAYLYDARNGFFRRKLVAPDASAGDSFGAAVALSASYALISSHLDDDTGADSGSAYLFEAGSGVLVHKLVAPDGAPGDMLGAGDGSRGVAISGSWVLLGAHHAGDAAVDMGASCETGGDNASNTSVTSVTKGAAYLFDAYSGTLVKKYISPDAADEDFGWAVALSYPQLIVGDWKDDDDGGVDSGSVYLFGMPTTTSPLTSATTTTTTTSTSTTSTTTSTSTTTTSSTTTTTTTSTTTSSSSSSSTSTSTASTTTTKTTTSSSTTTSTSTTSSSTSSSTTTSTLAANFSTTSTIKQTQAVIRSRIGIVVLDRAAFVTSRHAGLAMRKAIAETAGGSVKYSMVEVILSFPRPSTNSTTTATTTATSTTDTEERRAGEGRGRRIGASAGTSAGAGTGMDTGQGRRLLGGVEVEFQFLVNARDAHNVSTRLSNASHYDLKDTISKELVAEGVAHMASSLAVYMQSSVEIEVLSGQTEGETTTTTSRVGPKVLGDLMLTVQEPEGSAFVDDPRLPPILSISITGIKGTIPWNSVHIRSMSVKQELEVQKIIQVPFEIELDSVQEAVQVANEMNGVSPGAMTVLIDSSMDQLWRDEQIYSIVVTGLAAHASEKFVDNSGTGSSDDDLDYEVPVRPTSTTIGLRWRHAALSACGLRAAAAVAESR